MSLSANRVPLRRTYVSGEIFALLLWEKTVAIGFLFTRMTRPERIAALGLFGEFRLTGEAGVTPAIAGALWPWRQRSRAALAAA